MFSMFWNTSAFNQDQSSWDVGSVLNCTEFSNTPAGQSRSQTSASVA